VAVFSINKVSAVWIKTCEYNYTVDTILKQVKISMPQGARILKGRFLALVVDADEGDFI